MTAQRMFQRKELKTVAALPAKATRAAMAALMISALTVSSTLAQTPGATPSATTPGSPPPDIAPAARPGQAMLTLSAQFSGNRKPVRSGLVWRVLSESADGSPPKIIARSNNAEPSFPLDPGIYLLHAAYGFASATKRVTLGPQGLTDRLSISAGGLSLAGSIGETPIAPNLLNFSVFVPLQGNSEGRLVASSVKSGELIRLPEGTYHIVSTYGDSNAIQRSDVRVESGQVTQATLHHRAAQVTLKLVAGPGGEAFAGTAFSVLTPGGDVIREAIGAFPQVILAEGDYVLIARQEGQVFSRDFKVEAGRDRDIEVIAR